MTREMFNETFGVVLDMFCPNGECIGVNITELNELDLNKIVAGDDDRLNKTIEEVSSFVETTVLDATAQVEMLLNSTGVSSIVNATV